MVGDGHAEVLKNPSQFGYSLVPLGPHRRMAQSGSSHLNITPSLSLLPHATKTRPCVSWALTTACPRLLRLTGWSWLPMQDGDGSGGASHCFLLRRKLLALLQGCTLSSKRLKAIRACSDYFHFPDSTWQNKWVNSRDLSSL